MAPTAHVSICLLAEGDELENFRRCLSSVIDHTPLACIALRLAFSRCPASFHHALGVLCPDEEFPEAHRLPGGVERFRWTAQDALPVCAWYSPTGMSRAHMIRLMFHDVALDGEYVVTLDQNAFVEGGWWNALWPLLESGTDYIGQPGWHSYLPAEAKRMLTRPWYMGVPFAQREGRAGVNYMRGGFVVARVERLREVNFPQPGVAANLDVELGEMARQLGWSQAAHDQYVQLPQV
jgi:hypothetical protein